MRYFVYMPFLFVWNKKMPGRSDEFVRLFSSERTFVPMKRRACSGKNVRSFLEVSSGFIMTQKSLIRFRNGIRPHVHIRQTYIEF